MSWNHVMAITTGAGTYDEALERLHLTGPEFEGWLSNHGPMAVEALAHRGAEASVHAWVDGYVRRLEPLPRASDPITDAQASLGDPRRLADWIAYFTERVDERPWTELLVEWWPVLLPGIAAGATHGVIRVGHATRALRAEETEPRRIELAQALGYWAARWQPVPVATPRGSADAETLVASVPRVARQEGGISERLAQLSSTAGWMQHGERLRAPTSDDDVTARLDALVDAVVLAYPKVAIGNPTMLVHAATAPNAVARVLPSLPRHLWRPSFDAAWAATSAVLAAYLPADPPSPGRHEINADPDNAWEIAVRDGGEHIVKLADTALDVHRRTGDPRALDAVATAVALNA
jgi:hypothetical protein